jgi:hypothetical protein
VSQSRKLIRPSRTEKITFTEYAIIEDIIVVKNLIADVSNDTDLATSLRISFEPFYRVVLLYTQWEDDKKAASRLVTAVSLIKIAEGVHITRSARKYGMSIVVTVLQAEAELYLRKMRANGLDGYTEMA